MSLATYEEARPWAKAIKEEILERRMPPWPAVKGFGTFSNAPSITQREIDLIVNWVEGGAPKGEDLELPKGPLFSADWQLGKPDLTLKLNPEQRVRADTDEYRTIGITTGLKENRWLKAIDLKPEHASVLHCATVYLDERDSAADAAGSRTLLLSWIPGQKAAAFPADAARLLPANSKLTVRIHYRGDQEKAVSESSSLGLYFTGAPRLEVADISMSSLREAEPSGNHVKLIGLHTVDETMELLAIRPASGRALASTQVTAYRPDGSEEILLWTRGSQFDWQQMYFLKRPAILTKGTRVEVLAYFANDELEGTGGASAVQVRSSDAGADPLCTLIVVKNRTVRKSM